MEEITYSFILSLLLACAFTVAIYNLSIIKVSKKGLIICSIIYFITIIIGNSTSTSFIMPISVLMISLYFVHLGQKVSGVIISIIFSYLFIAVADITSGFSTMILFNTDYVSVNQNLRLSLIIHVEILIITFILSKAVSPIGKRLGNYIDQKRGLTITRLITGIAAINAIIIYLNVNIAKYLGLANNKSLIIMFLLLFLIYLFMSLGITYIYNRNMKRVMEVEYENREYKELVKYTRMLEDIANETRKFKHDFVNILSTINGYVKDGDIKGLEEYFDREVMPESSKIIVQDNNVGKLKYIKLSALKGLLFSKIIKAQLLDIEVNCDIRENIDMINIQMLDLARIIGVLFDNAIEAAEISVQPKVNFTIIKDNKKTILILENTYIAPEKLSINNMFTEGFTTKENHDGIGLASVRKLIDERYPNILLDTEINENTVIQKLYI